MTLDDELRATLHGQVAHVQAAPTLADEAVTQGRALLVRRRAVAAGAMVLLVGGIAFAAAPRIGRPPVEPVATPSPSEVPIQQQRIDLGRTGIDRLPVGPPPREMSLVVDGRVIEVRNGRAREVFALPGKHVIEQQERTAAGYVALAAPATMGADGVPWSSDADRRIVLVQGGAPVTLTRGYDGADERYRSVEVITSFAVSPDGRRLAYSRRASVVPHTVVHPDGSKSTTSLSPGAPELADLVEIELPSGRVLHRRHSGYDGEMRVVGRTGTAVYVSPDAGGSRVLLWTPGNGSIEPIPLRWLWRADAGRNLGIGVPLGDVPESCFRLVRLVPMTVLDDYTCVRDFTPSVDGNVLVNAGREVELRRAADLSRFALQVDHPYSGVRGVAWDGPRHFFVLVDEIADHPRHRWFVLRCDAGPGTAFCERAYTVPGEPAEVSFLR